MLPSQENLLVDYVRRLEDHKEGRKALHIKLSALKPYNRREQHVRAAANNFEPFIKDLDGQLFSLKNSDFFFIYKQDIQSALDTLVQQVRYMFSDDPLFEKGVDKDHGDFTDWYDAEADFDKILKLVQRLAEAEHRRQEETHDKRQNTRSALKARQEKGDPLTPEVLGRVETSLSRADLSNLVRRQFVCLINKQMTPEQRFSELYISIKDLRETLLPGVNLLSNPWLFQHLTETLDRRMLAMLSKTDTLTISGDISFNMNVSTLLAAEFLNFDDNITAARRGAMIIEVQKQDIFADIGAYLFAREFVHEKGYRVCLDGLSYKTLSMVDRERLGVDFVKLVWDPEMGDQNEEEKEKFVEEINKIGRGRVILCRVDNREAIDFGKSMGIELFQGRFVENLIAENNRRFELLRLKRRMERSEMHEG
ncbi:MAG TPA: EAL domain-containing protein [Rhodospirillales bacterium]|nr:EAL domain-containing protein [Rhodospirillales bacterium]